MHNMFGAKHLDQLGVTRLGDITDLDLIGIPVWSASRPNSRGLSQTQGKGLTELAAKTSAVMEAAEHYYAETADQNLETVRGTLIEFSGDAVPLDKVSMCDNQQLDSRRERLWCRGRSLINDSPCLAPYELVGLDFRINSPWDRRAFRSSTIGLGAGRTKAEATAHALLEIVENSATVLLDSFGPLKPLMKSICDPVGIDPSLDEAILRVRHMGFETHFAAIPCRVGFPVIGAFVYPVSATTRSASSRTFAGYACRPNVRNAALSALLEAVQSRLTDIAGARDDIDPTQYEGSYEQPKFEQKSGQSLETIQMISEIPEEPGALLAVVLEQLQRYGVGDIYVFELSPQNTGYFVVRVLVPDLDHASSGGILNLRQDGIAALLATLGDWS